jgi:hypothetical protein
MRHHSDAERAVCSGLAGMDSAVSDSTERRSESEWEPMPRAPTIRRMETTIDPCRLSRILEAEGVASTGRPMGQTPRE